LNAEDILGRVRSFNALLCLSLIPAPSPGFFFALLSKSADLLSATMIPQDLWLVFTPVNDVAKISMVDVRITKSQPRCHLVSPALNFSGDEMFG
jgi:hypothetical protein